MTADPVSLAVSLGALTVSALSLIVSVLSYRVSVRTYRRASVSTIVLPGYEREQGVVTQVGCHVVNEGTNPIQVTDVGLIFERHETAWLSPDAFEGPALPRKIDGYHEETWKFDLDHVTIRRPTGFIAVVRLGTGQILRTEWTSFD